MYRGADRDIAQRQGIARLNRRSRTAHQARAGRDSLGGDDVTALAVGVAQQSQVGAAVRIVFQALDRGRDTILVALEIHHAVMLLVAAPHMAGSDMAIIIAARGPGLFFQQRRDWLALVQIRVDQAHYGALPRGCWFQFNQCHDDYPCTLSPLTLNIISTAALISGLVASVTTRKTTCSFLSATWVAFSDICGASSTFIKRSWLNCWVFMRTCPPF